MNNFEKYKHDENVNSIDYYSKCNTILHELKTEKKLNSNQYFYHVFNIIQKFNKCKENEH